MRILHKENNSLVEAKEGLLDLKQSKKVRPNIDHLIKRIITERRQESRKNLLTFIVVLLVIGGLFIFFY
jgi:hypothetical protein|tara:strand:- start:181 stop:387 length:207 start_codon:yes stop_codon:yes gene_type:complete